MDEQNPETAQRENGERETRRRHERGGGVSEGRERGRKGGREAGNEGV